MEEDIASYFYVKNLSNDEGNVNISSGSGAVVSVLQYSYDANTWVDFPKTTAYGSESQNVTIYPQSKVYIRGSAECWQYKKITCNKSHEVGGNITSLFNMKNGGTTLPRSSNGRSCVYMFSNSPNLISAEHLVLAATKLTYSNHWFGTYYDMFRGSTNLLYPPKILLKSVEGSFSNLFSEMFYGCTSLLRPMEFEPEFSYTGVNGFKSMYYGCTSLTTTGRIPLDVASESCCEMMFLNCSSLENVPESLPASTAVKSFQSMFWGCSSLSSAPLLPATSLSTNSYASIFYNCTNLSSVTCLATDISASGCTSNWLSGVAPTGTFTTPSSTAWATGASGIPSGWTRVDYNE